MTPIPRLFATVAATAALVLGAAAAVAQTAPRVAQPWVRATLPGQPAAGGYFTLTNPGPTADRLLSVSVSADVSRSVELHTMSMDGDVMRMRPVDGIDVPAGGRVELKPGGLHVMFIGLKGPLKAGTTVPATLRFEKAGDVKVTLAVSATPPATAPAAAPHAGSGAHHGH